MTLRTRERQVQEAEERADELLRSAAADIDKQSQALQQHRQAFEQVSCHWLYPDHTMSVPNIKICHHGCKSGTQLQMCCQDFSNHQMLFLLQVHVVLSLLALSCIFYAQYMCLLPC